MYFDNRFIEITYKTDISITTKGEKQKDFITQYWLRHIITMSITIAIIFMIACTITVILLIANGNIRIRSIKDDGEEEEL